MKFMLGLFCALCLISDVSSAEQKALSSCSYSKSAKIHFSSSRDSDELQVSVKGEPCWKGTLLIQVLNKSKKALYSYKAEFKPHTAVGWDDPYLPKAASMLVDSIISDACLIKTSSDLPLWKDPKAYYDEFYHQVTVPEQEYNRIRAMKLPIFCHPIGYEEDIELVYDAAKKQAIKVRSGGS